MPLFETASRYKPGCPQTLRYLLSSEIEALGHQHTQDIYVFLNSPHLCDICVRKAKLPSLCSNFVSDLEQPLRVR